MQVTFRTFRRQADRAGITKDAIRPIGYTQWAVQNGGSRLQRAASSHLTCWPKTRYQPILILVLDRVAFAHHLTVVFSVGLSCLQLFHFWLSWSFRC